MSAIFVDANVFLRFFTSDDHAQQAAAAAIFDRAASGAIELVTGPPVLIEIAWTLRKVYGEPRERILDKLESITGIPGLRMTDAEVVLGAIALARRCNVDFADAYVAALANSVGASAVATFNSKHFTSLGVKLAGL